MSYFLAPTLDALRNEVNQRYPNRDKASDGWIGDPSHAARASDHNPCWTCSRPLYGVVRAVDIDISPDGEPNKDLRTELLETVIGDPRTYYVISNGKIYSRTYGFKALSYNGTNGHYAHVHVSARYNFGEFDRSPWFDIEKPRKKPIIQVSAVQRQFNLFHAGSQHRLKATWGVRSIQQALNEEYGLRLATDGIVGPATVRAWANHEEKVGGRGRLRTPDGKSLKPLPLRLKWKEAA